MGFAVLAKVIKDSLADVHENITFVWHGGESTIVPISFYEKAVYLQSYFKRPDQIIQNVIQTNGTLINKNWVELHFE